ncbi:YybS family protein [Desulfococcus sp.]|uniref:YybS family protein n=1 Tax=Desulfococcus sp. TaxID=2025834 RepID=UPI003593807A
MSEEKLNVLPTGRSSATADFFRGIFAVGLLFYAATHIPVVGFFFSLLIPVLILFYRLRLGQRAGGIIPVVSGAAMALTLGAASFEMLFFAELMLLGFVMGELFERNLPIERTVLLTCAIAIASGGACLAVYSSFSGISPWAMVSDYVDRNLQMTLALYESVGMAEEVIRAVSESLEAIHFFLVRILPSLAVSSVLFITWTTLVMVKPVTRRYGLAYPDFGRLNHWRAPEWLVWGVIGSGILLLFPHNGLRMVGVNGLIILMTVYFFNGIAIVSFFLEKKRLPLFLRIGIYMFIALQQIALFLVIGIGFFDIWFNFRKLETPTD